MPLFRVSGNRSGAKVQPKRRGRTIRRGAGSCCMTEDDDCVPSLQHMCLVNLADNMKEVWVKDYADNYVDQYSFRYIMGPFNVLPGELVEELTLLLCRRKQLSRPTLHLLLVPQLRHLSLEKCPALVTPALCGHIAARCQGLCSLDLSGAQQLPAKVLCETVHSLPALRSLSLCGMRCDRSVIQTVVDCCRSLRHLDVSHCHLLSPASLLPLGGVCPSSSSSSPSQSSTSSSPALRPPLPLGSLLALDIGFGEQEEDSTMVAAYLLLSLPCLESVALEGLAPACGLLEREEFLLTDEFADRERVPRLEEVWRERTRQRGGDSWERRRGCDAAESDEEESVYATKDESDEEEGVYATKDESEDDDEPPCGRAEGKPKAPSRSELVLQLRSVQGVTCASLDRLSRLCPDMRSVSVNVDPYSNGRQRGSLLAARLKTWAGQLRSLSFQYPGPLVDLLLPLQVAGSSLLSLSLEGVKTSPHSPLLEVIRACPRLREFHIYAEPPDPLQIEEEFDWDLPQLPHLYSFKLSFSYDHNQKKPFMFWMSLTKVLTCLLTGSPLLEKLSLISLPCPLNSVVQGVLLQGVLLHVSSGSPAPPPLPLGRVRHLDLTRTDVQMVTLKKIMQRSRRLKYVDISHCWQVTQLQWLDCKRFKSVELVWV